LANLVSGVRDQVSEFSGLLGVGLEEDVVRMAQFSPVDLIRTSFAYLFDKYGFKVVEQELFDGFGNWIVVMQLEPKCRTQFRLDRGELFILFGPIWSPPGYEDGPWYDIDVVLEYLGGKNKEYINDHSRYPDSIEEQMSKLALIVRPLLPRICELFSGNNFEIRKMELDQIYKKRMDEFWAKHTKKE